jgi:hypothetical protein
MPSTSVLISCTCSSRLRISAALAGSSARAVPTAHTEHKIPPNRNAFVDVIFNTLPCVFDEAAQVSVKSVRYLCELTHRT